MKWHGAAMQIADWLEKLGLSQYAQCFAENDIRFVILPDLTDQDLEEDRRGVARPSASAAARDSRIESCRQASLHLPLLLSAPPAAAKPEHGRAPPSHGDVLRLGRLNGALGAHGP